MFNLINFLKDKPGSAQTMMNPTNNMTSSSSLNTTTNSSANLTTIDTTKSLENMNTSPPKIDPLAAIVQIISTLGNMNKPNSENAFQVRMMFE